jgi:hypothetical protein
MSSLQVEAKSVLVPLITSHRWTLDLQSQRTLASWATMFTMVYESGVPEASGNPTEAFRQFASTREPLPYWVVSFGSYSGTHWLTRIESYSSFVKYGYGSPYQPKVPLRTNTQATTAGIGTLLLHTFYSLEFPPWLLDEHFHRSLKLYRIWPPAREVIEPTLGQIDDQQAFRISSAFREFDAGRRRETFKFRSINRGRNMV